MALWGGRFKEDVAVATQEFGASLPVDNHLYKQDIAGSKAHARMLATQHIISQGDCGAIVGCLDDIEGEIDAGSFPFHIEDEDIHMAIEGVGCLDDIEGEIDAGSFPFHIEDEDIHMAIEGELTRRIGEAGKRLHTGRSRNDQVATDTRLAAKALAHDLMQANLHMREALIGAACDNEGVVLPGRSRNDQVATDTRLAAKALAHDLMQANLHMREALIGAACDNEGVVLPGMTHLQHAQPVLLSHHLLASRNDQVATDTRLAAKALAHDLMQANLHMREALIGAACDNEGVVLPGMTHLQHAQPVLLSHHLLAYYWMFERDFHRLTAAFEAADASPLGAAALAGTTYPIDRVAASYEMGFARVICKRDFHRLTAAFEAADASPLGAAALAGTTYPIDRVAASYEMGFARVICNSLDAVSDRDFILDLHFACSTMAMHLSRLAEEIVLWSSSEFGYITLSDSLDAVSDRDFILDLHFACSTMAMHLSRLAEEIVLWSSSEFGYITLSDAYSTGSSIMPQKKNPDFAELIRGKTGRVYGNLLQLLVTCKGLPLAYNKDLQEDKGGMLDSARTLSQSLAVMAGMISTCTFNADPAAAGDVQGVAAGIQQGLARGQGRHARFRPHALPEPRRHGGDDLHLHVQRRCHARGLRGRASRGDGCRRLPRQEGHAVP